MNPHWNDVSLRLPCVEDIPFIADYWYDTSPGNPHLADLRPDAFPPREEFEANLRKRFSSQDGRPTLFIVEYKGQAIGMHPINGITEDSAKLHAHIWDKDLRGRGIGLVSATKAAAQYFEIHGFKKIFAQPPKANPMSSRAAQKVPLQHLGTIELDGPITLPGTLGESYVLNREDLDKLIEFVKYKA